MANDNKVTLEIDIDAKDAEKAIEQFGSNAIKSVKKTQDSFDNFGGSIKSLAGNLAGLLGPLVSLAAVYKSISEANEAEKATRALAISIASTGEYSKEALASMQEFSNTLSDLTSIDDDVINSQLALAKSFGLTNEQSKNLVKAATNLSAVTGVELETAVRQLGGTFDGTVGKLGNLGSEFRALTKEQAQNGAVVDLVNAKYKDAGKILGDTFEGDLNRVKNAFNDTFKAIGQEIISDPNLRGGLKALTDGIKAAGPIAVATGKIIIETFRVLGTGAATIIGGFTGALSQLSSLVGANGLSADLEKLSLSSYEVVLSLNQQTESTKQASDSASTFETQMNTLSDSYDKNSKNAEKNAKVLDDLKKQYADIAKSVENAGLSDIEIARKLADQRTDIVKKALKQGIISEEEASKTRIGINEDFTKSAKKEIDSLIESSKEYANAVIRDGQKAGDALEKINKLEKTGALEMQDAYDLRLQIINDFNAKRLKETEDAVQKELDLEKKKAEEIKSYLGNIRQSPGAALGGAVTGTGAPTPEGLSAGQQALAIAISTLNETLKGREGAKNVLGDFVGKVGESLLGPGAAGLGDLFKGLSVGKEQAAAMVKEFVRSIPEIIKAVAEAIPAVIDALVEVFSDPGFWVSLGKAILNLLTSILGSFINNILQGIADAGTTFASQIGPALSQTFSNLGNIIFDSVRRGFLSITGEISRVFSDLTAALRPLIDSLDKLIDPIERLIKALGGGGGDGLAAEWGQKAADYVSARIPGLSKGGVVYAAGGFSPRGTDTVPAMLTPGEMVIPRDMVGELGQFLNNNGSGGQNEAVLMAILNAVQQPVVVHAEAKVNQSAFADIILQLNRQNARLSA